MRGRHIPVLLALVAGCALAAPPLAAASTVLGDTNVPSSTSTAQCPADVTVVQTGVGASGPSFAVPSPGGVITSWSYYAAVAGDKVQLDLVQPANFTNGYTVVARSDMVTASQGPNTFLTRVIAHTGDMLGVTDFGPAGSSCWRSTSDVKDMVASCTGCDVFTPPGTLFNTTPATSLRANVAAVLEPDADGDGYGDETQDKCLDDPYTWAQPCSADLAVSVTGPATVTLGGEIDYQVTIMNNGPSIAKGVAIVDQLPPGVSFISSHSTAACNGTTTIVCTVPPITPYTTAPATFIAVSADQLGAVANTVSVSHGITPDPNPANDSATLATNVTPVVLTPEQIAALFGGLSVAPDQTLVPNGKRVVRVKASCPPPGDTYCRGTLTLTTKGKVTLPRTKAQIRRHRRATRKVLTLGKATFTIPLNKSASISVRLSSATMSILGGALSLDVVATAAASDAAAHTKTTSGPVLLVAPDKPKHKKRRPPKRKKP